MKTNKKLKAHPKTKLAVLRLTKALWLWLSKHPSCTKDQWPHWKEYDQQFVFDCPCCDHVASQQTAMPDYLSRVKEFDCVTGQCPLAGFAWGQSDRACCNVTSPYNAFVDAGFPERLAKRKSAALQMVTACELAIKAEKGTKCPKK